MRKIYSNAKVILVICIILMFFFSFLCWKMKKHNKILVPVLKALNQNKAESRKKYEKANTYVTVMYN